MPFPELGAFVPPSGVKPARIMIVGEAPGADEVRLQEPFVGTAGQELTKMLHEAGLLRSECFITNAVRYRPPRNDITNFIFTKKTNPPAGFVYHFGKFVHPCVVEGIELLKREIEEVKPELILAFGGTALWALTDGECDGITKWRGSQIERNGLRILPTIHPATILRQWEQRNIAVHDLRRAKDWLNGGALPREWRFELRPSFDLTMARLTNLIDRANTSAEQLLLSVDLETRAGHIACCGIAWSETEAISIPLMCVENPDGYFDLEQETAVVDKIRALFTHPRVRIVGQNFAYDIQYIYRYWKFCASLRDDTLVAQGLLFPGLPKSLDFLSSIYCEHHLYWKDDGKNWNPKTTNEEQLWAYNCVDACRTYEIILAQRKAIDSLGFREQYAYLLKLWYAVLGMMIRGVLIDKKNRGAMSLELMNALAERDQWFTDVLGHPFNPRSSKQMQALFYDDLRAPIQKNRKTGNTSLDDKSLEKIRQKSPLLEPLIKTIQDYRSIGVFLSTFVQAPLDVDEKMRCSYNIVGAETFRFNSSENAFGSGTNLQNIPKGNEAPKAGELSLPNIRKLFIPPPNFIICDADLDRADLQVVVWEADDDDLKAKLREGVDMHSENAKDLGISRPLAKAWVHGTNYGGGPRTMAINCGITIHQAEKMRNRWFQIHPGIKDWHDRTMASLETTRSVYNKFGFRRFYFDRIEGILPEALAWIPQSTVACVINKGLLNLAVNVPEVEILLQVHDSLVFQLPESKSSVLLPRVRESLLIPIPYEDPLTIPIGLKASNKSWGEVKDREWK